MTPKPKEQSKPIPDVECLKYHGMPEKPDVKIFVSHRIDLDSETIDNPLFIPVRCGAIYDNREGTTMLGDDTGNNISEKRGSFCELTVQYWAWKNIKADYYGLCHYRRYFSFSARPISQTRSFWSRFDYLEDCVKEFKLDNIEQVRSIVKAYDCIVGDPVDFSEQHFETLYAQYDSIAELHLSELECAIDILKELYPEFTNIADRYLNGHILYSCNMFVMKKELFAQYNQWLFSILTKLEERIDTSLHSVEERRGPAHIAERLMGVFYLYIKENCPQYKTCELHRGFIRDSSVLKSPKPAFQAKNIPVVFASSNAYFPYAAQTIQSLIEHSSDSYNYDLIFLHKGITTNNQNLMQVMLSKRSNFSFRFFNINRLMRSRNLVMNPSLSVETFYRLLIPKFLHNYHKVIYLDCDLTVLRDVADLFEIDIGNNLLAATIDNIFPGRCREINRVEKQYSIEVLKLENSCSYFQAGVLVFNIDAFKQTFTSNELMQFAERQQYRYADQDVLNALCQGRVYFLEANWDVLSLAYGGERLQSAKMAPAYIYENYLEARKLPYIVHHAGIAKPWDDPEVDFAYLYWRYVRNTPFYEINLKKMMQRLVPKASKGKPKPVVAVDERSGIRKLADKLLPKGTRRRKIAKKLLPKGSRRWNLFKRVYCLFAKR